MPQEQTEKRDFKNQQDLTEVLEIMNYSLYTKKVNNFYVYLWYMKSKGKLKDVNLEEFTQSFGGNINEYNDIAFAMDQVDSSINLLKSKIVQQDSGNELTTESPKFSDKLPMINMTKQVLLNLANKYGARDHVYLSFMYGYYIKAGVIDILDLLELEDGNYSTSLVPMATVAIQIMKNVDKNLYLDKDKFKNKEITKKYSGTKSTATIKRKYVRKTTTDEKSSDETVGKNKPTVTSNPEKTTNKDIISIRGGKSINIRDIYELYAGGISYKDISESYGVCHNVLRKNLQKWCADNGLKYPQFRGNPNFRKPLEKKESSESETVEDIDEVFLKAQEKNSIDIINTKSNTLVDKRPRGDYSLQYYPGTNEKITIGRDIRKKLKVKNLGGYYTLDDGKMYYVTKDGLVFKDKPSKEVLESLRNK